MKPTIKYLLNGEYHYATVKDIGDIDRLKTTVRSDLVGAINSLIGYIDDHVPDELYNKLDQFEEEIESIKTSGFNEAQLVALQGVVTALTEEAQARIEELKLEYSEKIDVVTSNYDKKVADITTDLENVKTNVESTEKSLEETGKNLSAVELNVTNVSKEVNEIDGKLKSKVDSTEFDLLEATVSSNETAIEQNKKDIKLKASQENLDLATGRIEDAESKIELNAQGITSSVKRDELRKELDEIDVFGANLLRSTRDWEGWESNNPTRAFATSDTYNHTHIQEQTGSGAYLQDTISGLVVGETYTASVWTKSSMETAKAIFRLGSTQHEMKNHNNDTAISSSWQRYSVKFVATHETETVSFTVSNASNDVITHFAGGKVERGTEATGWQANEEDVYGRLVSAESIVKQHADQITSLVSEQTKIGENITSQQTEINQMSDSIGLHATKLEEIDGEVSQQKASIELNSNSIKSKVEQTDIDKTVEGISIDSRNLVLNSDFILGLENWHNVNEDFKVQNIGGKHYLSISRSGLSKNMIANASSNMFAVETGDKLSIGLDILIEDISKFDIKTLAILDLYDINDTRVDFKEFTLSDLQGVAESNVLGRLTTRYAVERKDVAKARLRLTMYRNGKLHFTNISVQKGDIRLDGWSPAPEDSQTIQANMKTMIDQNAEQISLKAEKDTVDKLTGRVETAEAELKVTSDSITSTVTSFQEKIEVITDEVNKTRYAWTVWAEDEDGTGISLEPEGKYFMGVAQNKATTKPSLDPKEYVWTRIRGEDAESSVMLNLTNDSHIIPTAPDGTNGNYLGARTTAVIIKGSEDDTSSWKITVIATDGIEGSFKDNTYTVTNMTTDVGEIEFTATSEGKTLKRLFTLTKSKQGNAGINSTIHKLTLSHTLLIRGVDGSLTPNIVTLNSESMDGNTEYKPFNGYFAIYERASKALTIDEYMILDGEGAILPEREYILSDKAHPYVLRYLSNSPEFVKDYVPNDNIVSVHIELYKDKELTKLLDKQTVMVAEDGKDGEDSYRVEIVSTKGNIFKNGDIGTSLIAKVYRGSQDITDIINATEFRWQRVSEDINGDIRWNEENFGGRKSIDITSDDVKVRATFTCEILSI